MHARSLLVLTAVLTGLLAPAASPAVCTPGIDGCLPEASDCATGNYNGAWLGDRYGSSATCIAVDGTTIFYAGGNPTYPCGSIVVLDQTVADQSANDCTIEIGDNDVRYRAQVPADYGTTTRRYPVLYLLPGGGGDENSWFDIDLSEIADQGVIVVSPFNGIGMYNNWRNGRFQMESVIVDGLIPHIDATFRTIADRGHRSIAGFSQGGYGAMFLSARHPELFSAAASISGVLNIRGDWAVTATGYHLEIPWGQVPSADHPIFGNYVTDEVWWRDRNALDLVTNLRGIDLSIFTGNGLPGEYDGPADAVADGGAEMSSHREAEDFTQALRAADIPFAYEVHDGTHYYLYAADSLRAWVPVMLTKLGSAAPQSFDYRTAEPAFGAYGWRFTPDAARAPEFMEVRGASASGVTLSGSGLTAITTAPMFAPGQIVALQGAVESGATADAQGRITFSVDLGTPHLHQQFTPEALLAGQQESARDVRFMA